MFNKINIFFKRKRKEDESFKADFFVNEKEILVIKEQCAILQEEIETFFSFITSNTNFDKKCPVVSSEVFATIKNLKIKQIAVQTLLLATKKTLTAKLESKKISRFKNFFKKLISFGTKDYNATIDDHLTACKKEFDVLTTHTATITTLMEKIENWKEDKIAEIVKKYNDLIAENESLHEQVSELNQKNKILNDKKLLDFEKIMTGMDEQLASHKENCYDLRHRNKELGKKNQILQQKNEELLRENQNLKIAEKSIKFGFNKKAINAYLPNSMKTVKKVLQKIS